jgi:hypothetical protein
MQDKGKIDLAETVAHTEQFDETLEVPPKTDVVAVAQGPATPQETRAFIKRMDAPGAFAEYPKSSAVRELYESGVRGGGMVLLFSIVHGMESELRDTKRELETLRQSYHEECLKNARLESQLASERKLKTLQNIFLIGGGLLNTLAIKLYFDKQEPVGLVLLVLGLAFIFTGLLWSKGGNPKK